MLATIILDSLSLDERVSLAAALDMICSPSDNYGFASACIYAFWSIPEKDMLYIGLAGDIANRFRQHTGLIACDPKCCKRDEIEAYFKSRQRLGYSIIAQSPMSQPLSKKEMKQLAEENDDAFVSDLNSIVDGKQNIALAEGMLLELYRNLGDRYPPWNKIAGSQWGSKRRSLSDFPELFQMMSGMVAGKDPDCIQREIAEKGPHYELLLNLEGSELSDLNARATLREIAEDATICGHEEFLHAVRMFMVSTGGSFADGVKMQLAKNPYAKDRVDQMESDGYLKRPLCIPGLPPVSRNKE